VATGGRAVLAPARVLRFLGGVGPLVERIGRPARAFDLPGFGGSDPPARRRISCYGETIDDAFELLEVPRAIVATALARRCGGDESRRPPSAVCVASLVLLVPASHVRAVRRALPQADTGIWRGVGHHPQVEAPELLAELIDRTCDRARMTAPRRRAQRPRANQSDGGVMVGKLERG
jgi:pimeloyl-ACP methyl ester carboxylesterase